MLPGRLNPAQVIVPEAQFNYARADLDAVNLALSTVNWHALVNDSVPIKTAWHSFYKFINDVMSITIPKKSQRRKESKYMHYPKSLKRLRSIKLAKWRALKGHHDDAQLKASYKAAAANCNRAIQQWCDDRELEFVSNMNQSSFFKYAATKLKTSCQSSILIDYSGRVFT